MRVTIFGAGYVGLVTASCLAEVGNDVVCVDVDEGRIERLNRGEIPIYEPGLDALVERNHRSGRLRFSTDKATAIAHGYVLFIAVGTPSREDGSADLRYVLEVAGSIGDLMQEPKVVVEKSTVPVGTADAVREKISAQLRARGAEVAFCVASNPEFLKEGAAIADFMKPDRIIVGADDDEATDAMRELYAPFSRNHEKMITMSVRSAELTKYAANTMLAARISMMNEIANIAERLGADVEDVRLGVGSDPRIGSSYIYAGCGYGGSCFPKDVKALARTALQAGYTAEMVLAVDQVNERQKSVLYGKLKQHFSAGMNGLTVALWGLAFKPNTTDMREAPSLTLMRELWAAGASVRAYDPAANEDVAQMFPGHPNLTLCGSAVEALQGADALVLVTEWNEFKSPDFDGMVATLRQPVIVDGRNLWDSKVVRRYGLQYYGIGRL